MIDFLINIPFPYEVFIKCRVENIEIKFYIYIKIKGNEIFKKFQNLSIRMKTIGFPLSSISLRSQFLISMSCAIFIYFSSFEEF